jgi:hypothetical protein
MPDRQVHPTARSKSYFRSKINTICACAQPKVPSLSFLGPILGKLFPTPRRFAHKAKQNEIGFSLRGKPRTVKVFQVIHPTTSNAQLAQTIGPRQVHAQQSSRSTLA